jgi:hypothetical protein
MLRSAPWGSAAGRPKPPSLSRKSQADLRADLVHRADHPAALGERQRWAFSEAQGEAALHLERLIAIAGGADGVVLDLVRPSLARDGQARWAKQRSMHQDSTGFAQDLQVGRAPGAQREIAHGAGAVRMLGQPDVLLIDAA